MPQLTARHAPPWGADARQRALELAAYFLPPSLREDGAAVLRARLVLGHTVLTLLLLPGIAVLEWSVFPSPAAERILGAIAITCAGVLVQPWLLRATGSVALACNPMLACEFAMIAVIAGHSGGFRAPACLWTAVLPMAAALIAGRGTACVWVGFALAQAAVFVGLDWAGIPVPDYVPPELYSMHAMVSLGALTTMVAVMAAIAEIDEHETLRTLERTHCELAAARDAADHANRAKSDFLVNISHELRTPLTAILGFTDILSEAWGGVPDDRVRALTTIERNARHLLAVVKDLLDLSRVEAGLIALERLAFSPAALAREVAELLELRARERGLALEVELDPALPARVHGDPLRLRQILLNLVGNALKFTEHGSVRVRLRCAPAGAQLRLCIEVEDTGAGIPPETLRELFHPFVQGEAGRAQGRGGTGLGLALCKQLSEWMGGRIEAQSELGRGSCFRVEVPVGVVAGAPPAESMPPVASRAAPAAAGELLHVRLLLVDDAPDNRRLLGHVLRRAGAHVDLEEGGEGALERIAAAEVCKEPYDVVLMDLQMPGMDGYATTLLLRERGYRRPILALTAHAGDGERDKCLAVGCDDFATKPIDRAELIQRIRNLASR